MLFRKNLNNYQQIKRFRIIVAIFFISLVIPLALAVYYGFQKFENETLFQFRWKSSDAVVQINKILTSRFIKERERSPIEYYFYQYSNDNDSQTLLSRANRSPLSRDIEPHYAEDIHGLLGYFNIVEKKQFNSPLLPFNYLADNSVKKVPLSQKNIQQRREKINQLKEILVANDFLESQADTLAKNKILNDDRANITQVSDFKMLKTHSHQLIFYRNSRINQQDSVQGFIVDEDVFLYNLLSVYIRRARFDSSIQAQLIDKSKRDFSHFYTYDITKQGKASVTISNENNSSLNSIELFTGELVSPFQFLTLKFTTDNLPLSSATNFVLLFIVVLSAVIIMGTIGFYWLGVKQIALAEQRMNFVSSISHELKTPLTSILMYSEMLKSDLVKNDQKKFDYYHFIFDESERLSRLINNVLQLSNFSQNQKNVSLESIGIEVLKDTIQSKVSTLIIKNNFKLNFIIDDNISSGMKVIVDLDAFSQIVINLIDNAVKFYNAAGINDSQRQVIDVLFKLEIKSDTKLNFSIRDYGPGISNSQLDNIFELFYRCGNEMTRTTSGTGIGLALVYQLVKAQGGEIAVIQRSPGVSFDITLPIQSH